MQIFKWIRNSKIENLSRVLSFEAMLIDQFEFLNQNQDEFVDIE